LEQHLRPDDQIEFSRPEEVNDCGRSRLCRRFLPIEARESDAGKEAS
jgi:hypothetical protein